MERALSVINLEQVIKMCLLLLLHLGTTQAEELPLAQISASNAAPALPAASPVGGAVPIAHVPGAVPVANVPAAVPVAPVPAVVPIAPVASQTSTVPASPAVLPVSPAAVPAAPAVIPALPAAVPAAPAAIPASSEAVPASPAAVPAAPAAIPASPAAVPAAPASIPASSAAVPASPAVLPAASAALPALSAALPVDPASPTSLIATSAVLPAAPSALPNDSSVLPVDSALVPSVPTAPAVQAVLPVSPAVLPANLSSQPAVPALLPTDSAPPSVASNTSSAAPNPAESSVPPGDPSTLLPAVLLSATSGNVSISPALAKDPASPTVDPQIVAPPKPVNNETSDVGDVIHTLINATTAIKNSVFSHVDSIKENINDGKENKDLVKVTSIQDSAISPQTQIYIVAGCLGGVVFILILLILALALSVSKIKDQLSASNRYSPSTSNPQARGGDIFAYDNGAYNSREAQDRRQGEAEMQERVAEGNDDLEKMGYSVYNGRQDNPPNSVL